MTRFLGEFRWLFAGLALAIGAPMATPAMAQDPGSEEADTEDKAEPVDGRRVALIIGNGDYGGGMGWTNLPNAGNDAQHIADILSHENRADARFEVELVTNGTREEIVERLAAFAARAATADVAMVYFSGHGFEFNLDNYIVPVDAPAVVSQSNIDAYFINMSEIVEAAETDGFSIFFLDACRSLGPVIRLNDDMDGDRAALFGAIDAPHSVVFYATAMGDAAYDAAPVDAPFSPFATAVATSISMPGLDIPYVFTRVRDQVARATNSFAPPQLPQFAGSWSRPFYFLPPDTAVPAAPGPPAATVSPRTDQGDPAEPDPDTLVVARGSQSRLNISLETLGTVDEPILVLRVLDQVSFPQLLALAEDGDPVAMYLVGYIYEFGVCIEQNFELARQWLERAAATGHPAGQLELGYFLSRQGAIGERSRAISLVQQASDQGYAKAMSHLAAMLLTGKYGEFDPEEPFRLYRQAADLGHAWALFALTLRRSEPELQIGRLEAIAEGGNTEGNNWLCEIAQSGFTVENAFDHCLQAARAGYTIPRVYTALSYQQGTGVEASASRARYWARMALGGFDISEIHRNRMQTILG